MEINEIYNEDCLEGMKRIADGSIDMILCDLPYGVVQCKWDTVIPFEPLWEQYKRVINPNGAIALFGSEPFTSTLIVSNIKQFKYNWIWQKNKATGFLNAKKQPLNDNETVSIFYKKQCTYNPQMTVAEKVYKRGIVTRNKSDCYGSERSFRQEDTGKRYPLRIQYFNNNFTREQLHPTQKPVALFEYLIKTYTTPGELVLDNCMGSGTTAIACMNTKRNFIGFEMDKGYYDIACDRIEKFGYLHD